MPHTPVAIWEQFNEALQRFICKKVNHADCCNDILQDLYLKIYLNINKVERAENIRAYVMQMAHNAVTDYYRKVNKNPVQDDDNILAGLKEEKEEVNEYQLADCCLRPMIMSLPQIYRDALIFTELEGFTQQQLANKLNITLPAAKSRVLRAREKLREIILQCCSYEFDKYGNIVSCCEKNPVEKKGK